MAEIFFPDPEWLKPLPPGSPLATEWDTFCRELPRLISEGHAGKCALIKGNEVAGVWSDGDAAEGAGYERFGAAPFLVQEVSTTMKTVRAGDWWR